MPIEPPRVTETAPATVPFWRRSSGLGAAAESLLAEERSENAVRRRRHRAKLRTTRETEERTARATAARETTRRN